MPRFGTSRWPGWADPLIAGAIVAVGIAEVMSRGTSPGQVAAVVVMAGALAWRRRVPVLVLLVVVAALAVQQAAGYEVNMLYTPLALVISFYSVGAHCPLPLASIGLAAGLAAIAIGIALEGVPMTDLAFTGLFGALPWLAGAALRARVRAAVDAEDRARRAEASREGHAVAAVAEERARIARELHDLVAHSVSVMVMQAGALRRMLPADRPGELAGAIERTGREALVEMRRMLGLLRSTDVEPVPLAPLPGLARLDELVDRTEAAGVRVRLTVDEAPTPLPPGLDMCLYRIVQESLTNVIKHAGPAAARVALRFPPGRVELDIVDDGRGGPVAESDGHGLLGMRERVTLFGGELHAGPCDGRGFAVRARLPLQTR